MSDTSNPATLATSHTEADYQEFENAWRSWQAGQEPPLWQQFLPAPGVPCDPERVFLLLSIDIEFRARAGLPALLAEHYFQHARLQESDACLDAEQQRKIIAWEYQQRWQNGQRVRRSDYEAAFPQHAEMLQQLKPRLPCPQCQKMVVVEETWPSLLCPSCGSETPGTTAPPSFGAEDKPLAPLSQWDLRDYALIESLGQGGMGQVYRSCDPALERDLAVKVMKAELRGIAEVERRFLREARITGSLQHPSIVAVHNFGRLPDGRLHYTMRLVRGRTFAEILKEEAGQPERCPSLLGIFEKICQAVAYAHSKRVIHRDLKPANVMVGRFGEVQVMDWGLAKLLTADDRAAVDAPPDDGGTVIRTEPVDTPVDVTRLGSALGTPAYMSPEQAAGDWEVVDERADVFALGSILCEILTGRAAYIDIDRENVLRRARRGDLTLALGRLQQCGADAALVVLCLACLAPERQDRPRDAGQVAKRVATYQTEVQERLRQAELERATAEIRAQEEKARASAERRAKRRTVALTAAVFIMLAGSGGGLWWQQRKQEQTDRVVSNELDQAELLERHAQQAPLEPAPYRQALDIAQRAAKLAEEASGNVQQRAKEMVARLEQEEKAARRDRLLLTALLEVRGPQEAPRYLQDEKDRMAEPTVEELFASAFRAWGLDVDTVPTAEAAAQLKQRPREVVAAVIAALDEWGNQRRMDNKPPQAWRRLTELATALDEEPGSKRRELRAILESGRLPLERALASLAAALRPVPVPMETPLGESRGRLRQLAAETDATIEPTLGLLTLTRALRMAGEEALAERLLRDAIQARPREVVLYHTLGQLLQEQQPPRWAEAVEFYRAARALRADLGVALSEALLNSDRGREGLVLLAQMLQAQPDNPYLHFLHGDALLRQGMSREAEAACRQAIARKPDYAEAYNDLGIALKNQAKLTEAEEAYRQAIALQPDYAGAYSNLGNLLLQQEKLTQSEEACRKAIALQPEDALAYAVLGTALGKQGKYSEAKEACRRAIARQPNRALFYVTLGIVLLGQERFAAAEAPFRGAIALEPDYALAHSNLGIALRFQGRFTESLASLRRGRELGWPSQPWLGEVERFVVLENSLPAVLQGEASPANASDAITLADMCQLKKLHAGAARLFAEAFTADPRLAADLDAPHRYNAACNAALAAAAQGADARALPDKVTAMFRRWALAWLREDLTAYARLAEGSAPAANKKIQQALTYWRSDPDLTSVRYPSALDHLPDHERAAWQALWREVDELAKRVADKDKAGEKREH
jgi:serine/threonine-protein kinase